MSIVYTADVFCDGHECGQWIHCITDAKPPLKWRSRVQARRHGWAHIKGKDYCPNCLRYGMDKEESS